MLIVKKKHFKANYYHFFKIKFKPCIIGTTFSQLNRFGKMLAIRVYTKVF